MKEIVAVETDGCRLVVRVTETTGGERLISIVEEVPLLKGAVTRAAAIHIDAEHAPALIVALGQAAGCPLEIRPSQHAVELGEPDKVIR